MERKAISNLVSKCGIDCGACPWGPYPRKDITSEDFENFRYNAKRILGYMPIKTACVTCQIPDEKIPKKSRLPNRKCLIRRCVDKTGVANCAYCSRFPCDTLKETAGIWNRESIETRLGEPISEEEYHSFVQPFEGIMRLEAIRESIKLDKIVEPAKIPKLEAKITDFPKNLPLSKEEKASFKEVHKLLTTLNNSSLGLQDTDTFAQQHKLENLRAHVLRFLWILGSCGKLEKERDGLLGVDPKTYLTNRGSEKRLAIWSFVQNTVFKVLSEVGICCKRIALKGIKKEDLTTGTGYFRNKGWAVKMFFEESIGGMTTINAFQSYAQRLAKKYGKKAFKHFKTADMQILNEK